MSLRDPMVPVAAPESLRWRLPLLISALIASVLVTFLWVAFRKVEGTLVRAAGERIQGAADQVSGLLDGNRTTEQVRQLAASRSVREFLEAPTAETRSAAQSRVNATTGAGGRRVEVWDATGSRVLEASSPPPTDTAAADPPLPPGSPPVGAGVGPLQVAGAVVFADVVAEVLGQDPASRRLGFVRVRTALRESPPGIFRRLVGHEAHVKIGNRSGDVWTDLARVVPAMPLDSERRAVTEYRAPDGERRLGATAPVPATPWTASVDVPISAITAPARDFLRGMILVTLVFVGAAAVLAAALAVRITAPLADMNTAAAAFASGDYSQRVNATRRDEIGQLGRTFNAMAAEVQASAKALRQSEDRYRRLFAGNPHPMWVYDVETLKFLDVNDMAVVQYGYSREEFLAMTLPDIRPGSEREALREHLSQALPAAQFSRVWKHRRKNGTIVDVEVSSHELTVDGRHARAVLAHDITDRVMAQQALKESEDALRALNAELEERVRARTAELEAANQELEWFSYSVSHDLRAPLRHVQGYVEMLAGATSGQLSETAWRYLNTISAATVEMGELIDDLLAFSRIGRVQMSEQSVSLDAVVRDTLAGLHPTTRERRIEWRVAPLPAVTGDFSMLKQVYANVLGNAVKYTRLRDPAVIEVGHAGVEDGHHVLFVRDNGAGFDMRYADKLFGVFQRLHRADEFEGTGIGLAIVRRIITRHGGRTWGEGKVNGGATIYFTLRAAGAQEEG